ncbi:DEAD/DEAH box helicase [Bauldia sp.]|uniref:DEAD/DEAH box helicase n=1 Tax=Bauldia sp. TaxID=2575872 RepID=UPI003BACF074
MTFSELGLSPKVLTSVEAVGYADPTPIQQQAIPRVLERRDVLGIAQTGTGKTASFVLPMLTMLERGRARARMPRTLILEPTRELAAQVEENFKRYGANHKLTVALLIGGVSFDDQLKKLDRGVDVLIATPGRLLDLFERGNLLLSGVEILVIDEADRMLDMGFIPDIERICKLLPFTRQTLFFSATMPPEIQRLADAFLSNPVRVEVAKPATAADTVSQYLVRAGREPADKRAVLRALIKKADDLTNAIVFCNRKRDVAILQRSLARHGFSAGALHGDMDQRSRMATLDDFRNNKITILVASDVAARGLDIPAVSHIYNFDVPTHPEDYVHRIGRTGRAGRKGTSITIATPVDKKYVSAIEKLTGQPIETLEVEASEEMAASRYGKRTRKSAKSAEAEEPAANGTSEKPKKSSKRRSGDDQPRRGRQRSEVEDKPVPFGLSDHVPQFLLKSVRPAS